MSRNSQFVLDEGNRWDSSREIGPFFIFPAWWRRFIFQILTPREITVYLYMCSVMDENSIAFPSIEQISEDLGITKAPIRIAIEALSRRGFLLVGTDSRQKLAIYQRPSVAYTLLTLLKSEIVEGKPLLEGSLTPTRANRSEKQRKYVSLSNSVVSAGLRKILSKGAFEMYQHASIKGSNEVLRGILIADLQAQLQKRSLLKRAELPAQIDLAALDSEQVEFFKRFFPEDYERSKKSEPNDSNDLDDSIPF